MASTPQPTEVWLYILYDDQQAKDKNCQQIEFRGIRWIGQTIDPLDRLSTHKCEQPHLAHCRIILVRHYSGSTAILESLIDERILFQHRNLIPHLEPNTYPGTFSNRQYDNTINEKTMDEKRKADVFDALEIALIGHWPLEFPVFLCPICSDNFGRFRVLIRHFKEQHTLMNKCICPVFECSQTSLRQYNIFQHLKTKHRYTEDEARNAMPYFRKMKK